MRITVGHLIAFVAVLGIGVMAFFLPHPSTGGTEREITRTQVGSISTTPTVEADEPTVQTKTQVGSISTTPSVGAGELTVRAVGSERPECEGIFRAGQEVRYSGEGFTPGTSVRLFVSSPGLGSSGELEVAKLPADENGDITGTVRIPLGATGYMKNGAAGTVFLHAIGKGSAAAHLDDIAMVGLVTDTSSCGLG